MSLNFLDEPQDFEVQDRPDWALGSNNYIIYENKKNEDKQIEIQTFDKLKTIHNENKSQKLTKKKGKEKILKGNVRLNPHSRGAINENQWTQEMNSEISNERKILAKEQVSETNAKRKAIRDKYDSKKNNENIKKSHQVVSLQGNSALRLGNNLPSTSARHSRPLILESIMPQRSSVLKHPLDHCYDVQQIAFNPLLKGNYSKWKTYCPHHDSIHEEKIYQRKGTYIYIIDKVKSMLQVTEMWPSPKDIIIGAVSGKYHTFWFLRDDPSAVYATSLSSASVGQMGLGYNIKQASFETPQMIHFKKSSENNNKKGQSSYENSLKIACGEMHSIFLSQEGKQVFAAGSNLRGACGLGTSRCIYEATRVELPDGYIARHVAAGDAHTVIIARNEKMFEINDEIFVMGAARSGALGISGVDLHTSNTEPSEYTSGIDYQTKSIAPTDNESVTVSNWDTETDHRSDYAQQGRNDAQSVTNSVTRSQTTSFLEPVLENYLSKRDIQKSSELFEDEHPSNSSDIWIRHPQKLYAPQLKGKSFKGVYCNSHNTLLVTKSGEIYGMGSNECGSLGVGHDQPIYEPRVIFRCSTFNSDLITHVACGESHTIIVTDFRKIFVTGSNKLYQLGLHHNIDIHTFTRMNHQILASRVISLVRCGRHVSVIVTADNCVFCFGGRFGEFHESRYLRLSTDKEQILDVTIENDTPMLILGSKKKCTYRIL